MPYKDPIKARENQRKRNKTYREKHPDRNKKHYDKSNWKRSGIIFEDQFENVYADYEKQTNCESCWKTFKDSKDKQLDHDHNNTTTYNVRGIVCNSCNQRRYDRKWTSNTGERHIYLCVHKMFNFKIEVCKEKIVNKYFNNLNDAIIFRDEFLKNNTWIYT